MVALLRGLHGMPGIKPRLAVCQQVPSMLCYLFSILYCQTCSTNSFWRCISYHDSKKLLPAVGPASQRPGWETENEKRAEER